ncbi:HIT family protein [Chitiniphilus shinanonensis]|uniref:HIT family protein n=1 Tax=Chitiniphilus shinanonensis TaxID=553088 RepID=A0ABQ6BSV5_9NEIS|nr:HIT family protein [Chitiniphilus shinanonensis]GLS05085.1 HIT family protein [Chitiniphilus shinanonensis]
MQSVCELCTSMGGERVWQDDFCRVVLVDDPAYPGFTRVILNRHVAELSDLDSAERQRLMNVVTAVERVVRDVLHPDKINLASLGNMVPHLHWHVIPRWQGDRHFPSPVWAEPRRPSAVPPVSEEMLGMLRQRLSLLEP